MDNTPTKIQYTSHDAANILGISEAEFRILAKRQGLTAPFSDDDVNAVRTSLNAVDSAIALSTPDDFAAPIDPTQAQGLNPAMMQFCDALEGEIVQRLTTEMGSRMPRIKGAILDNLLPNQ